MQIRFEANQAFQIRAVASAADLFQGLTRQFVTERYKIGMLSGEFTTSRFSLDPVGLLSNTRAVQRANGIPEDTELKLITETVTVGKEKQDVAFPNFSIEMETGTGKTYVYLRTALELNRRHGLQKFIIVVPSVAIREAVLKTFKMTEKHFAELFDNVPYRSDVYDSRNLNKLRGFAEDDGIRFLIMTIDSFNKEQNVLLKSTDRLQGRVGLHMLQAVRPILILDEPQNLESAARIKALASLNPLAALRYSATHRNPYNLVYRLGPFEAYRQGLVKRIEVASVIKENDFNQVYVRVTDIASSKKTVTARIEIHQRMAGGAIKPKEYTFRPGDCLAKKAERSEYEPFVIEEINPGNGTVTFANGVVLKSGHSQGADEHALFREQLRYTVEAHFRQQARIRDKGIKVLSLIFIDRVENYQGDTPLIKNLFDEAFEELKKKYPEWANRTPAQVRGAYFAKKKRKGGIEELQQSSSGDNAEDRAAYALIMREKERLLSFEEPVCFIFSHSALKEGWDNPNVYQICTLNQTTSEIKKRQEVGRGMRLVVNQEGERVLDATANVLTVVANESYKDFVDGLQKEIEEEFGADEAKRTPKPTNAHDKKKPVRKPLEDLPERFKELWELIKWRTRYNVAVDTAALIAHVVADLNLKTIDPPKVVITKAVVRASSSKDIFEPLLMSSAKTVASLIGRFPLPNLVDKVLELLEHISPPGRLTRGTLLEIFRQVQNQNAILDNPEEFALKATEIIREKLQEQIVYGIQYEKDGTWYDVTLWEGELPPSDRVVPAKKSAYDYTPYQSEVERKFAEGLEQMNEVTFYVKLPAWFKVRTPVGDYNPDWGIVMEQQDQFGDSLPVLYLVRETKSTTREVQLYASESQKIECGRKHFGGALKVDYKVSTSTSDLV